MAHNSNSKSDPEIEEKKEPTPSQAEKGGIYKLFDLMKMDLGSQQTEEI